MLRHAAAHLARRARETAAGAQVRGGREGRRLRNPRAHIFALATGKRRLAPPRPARLPPLCVCGLVERTWAAGLQTRTFFCATQTPRGTTTSGSAVVARLARQRAWRTRLERLAVTTPCVSNVPRAGS